MSADFLSRIVGLVLFMILGARLGSDLSRSILLNIESSTFLFALVGMLFGLIMMPWLTVRPIRAIRRNITELPVEKLLMSILGLLTGLGLALLLAYPLSLLYEPLGTWLPPIVSIVAAYLGSYTFGIRSREIIEAFNQRINRSNNRSSAVSNRKLLLDTSALIDGRIVDVADTGFLGGMIIVPRFVLSELHRISDSSDPLRRNRGRRGLNLLNKLQRSENVIVRLVDDDFEEIHEVDNKLVALAQQLSASLITTDYNLGEVADAQGVTVLNVNKLANAVRSIYIPGETFVIRIIQEGRDPEQGIGYLDDGTMVIVEQGKIYMDRSIPVEVTKLINRDTGRMIFAVPEGQKPSTPPV